MMMNRIFKKKGRRGFSLLELLAVMSIMAMLTTLAVTSYFSAIRSMTRRSAVKHLVNTLILARQRACMEGARISVVVFNEITGASNTDVTPSYVICREIGRMTYVSGTDLVDEFTEIDRLFGTKGYGLNYRGSMKLYDLSRGGWSLVFPWVQTYPWGTSDSGLHPRFSASDNPKMTPTERLSGYSLNVFQFKVNGNVNNLNPADWKIGDAYGIEVSPPGALPRNFWFTLLQNDASKVVTVTFQPDGTATFDTLQNTCKVTIGEMQPPKKGNTIEVKSDGSINYNEDWN